MQDFGTLVQVLARNLADVGFKYTWKIEDYLKGVDGKFNVDSPAFKISVNGLNTEWSLCLRYWTDETGLRLTNPVVICLNLLSASAGVENDESLVIKKEEQLQVRYQFGILNNAAKQYEICPAVCKKVELSQSLQSMGTREIMILDRHLLGKSIEMFCKIEIIREELEQNTLAKDLWSKLQRGDDCDIKIRTCDGNLIPAHRTILFCRSPLVKGMIDEESGCIRLDDTTPIITSLLQYIYTDRVDPFESPLPQHLLKFAVKLQLPGLKKICEKALIDEISTTSVASLLLISDTFGCDALKKCALAFCGENPHAISKSMSWKVMEDINPKLFEQVCDQI